MDFTYNREQFLKDIDNKSTREQYAVGLVHLDRFCEKEFTKTTDEILAELKTKTDREKLLFLKRVANYIREKVSHSSTISYMSAIRPYLSLCYDIKVYDDDYGRIVTSKIKDDVEDYEQYALSQDEIYTIIEETFNWKRKLMYMVRKDTGARPTEALQLEARDFDFSGKFVKVTLRKETVKGKTKKRVARLTPETAKRLDYVRNLRPETNLFSTNTENLKGAYNNERNSWSALLGRIYRKTGDKKWITKVGRGKKKRWLISMHSFRAFTKTQILLATNNSEFADIYVGHKSKRANPTYTDGLSKLDDFDNLFERCIARLSIYDKIEVINESSEEIEQLKEELAEMKIKQAVFESVITGKKLPKKLWKYVE